MAYEIGSDQAMTMIFRNNQSTEERYFILPKTLHTVLECFFQSLGRGGGGGDNHKTTNNKKTTPTSIFLCKTPHLAHSAGSQFTVKVFKGANKSNRSSILRGLKTDS